MAELTPKQKELIKETWKIIEKDREIVGIQFFKEMFQALPEYLIFFQAHNKPDGNAETLLANEKFAKDHIVGNVMNAVGKLVTNVDNPQTLESVLVQLAKNHSKRKVTEVHFENAKVLLAKVFKQHLSNDWNEEVEQAWTIFITEAFNIIYKSL